MAHCVRLIYQEYSAICYIVLCSGTHQNIYHGTAVRFILKIIINFMLLKQPFEFLSLWKWKLEIWGVKIVSSLFFLFFVNWVLVNELPSSTP